MKRFLSLMLAVLLSLSLAAPAYADIIFEPSDSFYESHMDECDYYNRSCYANGQKGYVEVYSSPKSSRVEAVIPNGVLYWISWSWNGWGYIEYNPDNLNGSYGDKSGWIKLDELFLRYDSTSFFEEHSSEIAEGQATLEISESDVFYAWLYPGSGELIRELSAYNGDDTIEFSQLYTDSAGRLWGYLSYFYGRVNAWVCISEPENAELAPDENLREPELIPAADEASLAAAQKSAGSVQVYIIICAVAVVIIAAGLLLYIKKKKSA